MKISVVIPAYNRAGTLARAIDSVLAQSYKASEIIVVDDGSSDATGEVAKMYSEVLLLRQSNMGVSSARNNGVMMATHEWVAFLDSDDTWHPKKLAFQVAYHNQHSSCEVSYTDEVWMRNGREFPLPKKYQKPDFVSFDIALDYCNIAPSSVLIKKDYFEALGGFDESLEVCEDYDLWLRILISQNIELVPQKLMTKYGGLENQLSTKFWGMDRFRVRALEKHLNSEYDTVVRQTLIRKYELLCEGALKHNKSDDADLYKARIEQLKFGA